MVGVFFYFEISELHEKRLIMIISGNTNRVYIHRTLSGIKCVYLPNELVN